MKDSFGLTPVEPMAQEPPKLIIPVTRPEEPDANDYRGRPPVTRAMFRCAVCNRPPENFTGYYAETSGPPGTGLQFDPVEARAAGIPMLDCGRGYYHGFVKCHGAKAELYAPFRDIWRALDAGRKIDIFTDAEQLGGQPLLAGPSAQAGAHASCATLPTSQPQHKPQRLAPGSEFDGPTLEC